MGGALAGGASKAGQPIPPKTDDALQRTGGQMPQRDDQVPRGRETRRRRETLPRI